MHSAAIGDKAAAGGTGARQAEIHQVLLRCSTQNAMLVFIYPLSVEQMADYL
jgi:hypothetical protein